MDDTPGTGGGSPPAHEGEEDYIPLSALQHFLYCPRQCALIHVEQAWEENRFTAEGRVLHEAVSEIEEETRRGVRTVTAMPLVSKRLGISGVADLVELHEVDGSWRPFPVEYKRGRPKAHRADEVQLCAQAMALEEMFGVTLAGGALFYGEHRRRTVVPFDAGLRALTERAARDARALIASGAAPKPVYEKRKCGACSLMELCRPKLIERNRSATAWLARMAIEE